MPLYEYRCMGCGQRTEVLQRLSDAPLAVCPHCGAKVEKVVSAPALQFKGSGWYVTDYARSSGGNGAATGTADKPASAPAKSDVKPGETKPATPAKSETK